MLTYRTGAAGAPAAARFMSEHLLQQTLSPEMAAMAEYYEQGVTPRRSPMPPHRATAGSCWRHSFGGGNAGWAGAGRGGTPCRERCHACRWPG